MLGLGRSGHIHSSQTNGAVSCVGLVPVELDTTSFEKLTVPRAVATIYEDNCVPMDLPDTDCSRQGRVSSIRRAEEKRAAEEVISGEGVGAG